jgi:hypothetical protein
LESSLEALTVTGGPSPGLVLPEGIDLPEKDSPILLAAIEAGATHLLTGDKKHFGKYFGQKVGGVLVLRPRDYLQARKPLS